MRLSRLFVFSFLFTGLSLSAQAQYTSKSTTSTKAADKTVSTAASPTKANPYTGTATMQKATTAKTNPYTGTATTQKAPAAKANPYTGTATTQKAPAAKANPYTGTATTQKAPMAKQPTTTQPTFRPRPQRPATMPQTAGDDDLPSFDALEKPGTGAKGTASGSAQAADLPPPPPPKGEIWFYLVGNKSEIPSVCTWKAVLQNKTDTQIKRLEIKYNLLNEKIPMYFSNVDPNASVVKTQGLYSEKCPALLRSKPKVEVVACKMGTASGQDCLGYIVIK